jgi:hypothetical protein
MEEEEYLAAQRLVKASKLTEELFQHAKQYLEEEGVSEDDVRSVSKAKDYISNPRHLVKLGKLVQYAEERLALSKWRELNIEKLAADHSTFPKRDLNNSTFVPSVQEKGVEQKDTEEDLSRTTHKKKKEKSRTPEQPQSSTAILEERAMQEESLFPAALLKNFAVVHRTFDVLKLGEAGHQVPQS